MKKTEWKRLRITAAVILYVLVCCAGIFMMQREISRYGKEVLEREDGHLMRLASSADRNVDHFLHQCIDNLIFTAEQKQVSEAERDWIQTGDSHYLLYELKKSIAARDEKTADLVIRNKDGLQQSVSGRTDYQIFVKAKIQTEIKTEAGTVHVHPGTDGQGNRYLTVLYEKNSGVGYALLITMDYFYEQIAGEWSGQQTEQIMLQDTENQILIWRSQGQLQIRQISQMQEENEQIPLLAFLEGRNKAARSGFAFGRLAADTGQDTEKYLARMAAIPVGQGANSFFTILTIMDFGSHINSMQRAAAGLFLYFGLTAAGFLLLAALAWKQARKNSRMQKEAGILRQKNEAMEMLNSQTQKLAHRQRLETIGTLTSSIAHEFNNLLTPIMGYSMMALEKLPPEEEELYDDILEIYNTSRKAKEIISRLSDLARKNSANVFQKLSPDELIRRTLEVLRPAKPVNVEMRLRLDCGDQRINANEVQISQLLINLILNSFQAMEKEGGVLTVGTWFNEKWILIQIEDTGCGISKEDQKQIFEPFFSTKEAGKGTGLGLAIAAQVVEDHQGRIEVESSPGSGTTFLVSLPRFEENLSSETIS